jgi:hypothetical protein
MVLTIILMLLKRKLSIIVLFAIGPLLLLVHYIIKAHLATLLYS